MRVDEEQFIAEAAQFFSNPGRLIKGLDFLALPIEGARRALPAKVQVKISKVIQRSLEKAFETALKTLTKEISFKTLGDAKKSSERTGSLHTATSALAGGIAGFAGVGAIAIELPFTTMVMMRSIAQIAQEFGEDLNSPSTALECLLVFGLGGPNSSDDLTDTGYYATRLGLATAFQKAAGFVSSHGAGGILSALEKGTATPIIRFIAEVATHFEIRVTKKILLQWLPIAGAIGGGTVNVVFANFYSKAAKYHFGLKRLEREYGMAAVKAIFEKSS